MVAAEMKMSRSTLTFIVTTAIVGTLASAIAVTLAAKLAGF
jgi:hypothetical protein